MTIEPIERRQKLIENQPVGDLYCQCCRDFGVSCVEGADGRQVCSRNGLGQIQARLAKSIDECLADAPTDENPLWHQQLAQMWLGALALYQGWLETHPQGVLNDPPTGNSLGEEIGLRSETIVADILRNQVLLPWVKSVTVIEHNSQADVDGIDILIKVGTAVSNLLGTDTIHAQVKSNPKFLARFLPKLAGKRARSAGDADQVITQECFVFLNGGGGGVSEAGVIVPFVVQVYQLIRRRTNLDKRSSLDKGLMFIKLFEPRLRQTILGLCANGVLERDYRFIDLGYLDEFIEIFVGKCNCT